MAEQLAPEAGNLLIIERGGKRFLVLLLSDIDGTINDETRKESERLQTIGPAKEAFSWAEANGMRVGLVTSRATGETLQYVNELGIHGPAIAEDGPVIVVPTHVDKNVLSDAQLTEHAGRTVAVLSSTTVDEMRSFLGNVAEKVGATHLLSTLTTSPEALQEALHHGSVDEARMSADRLASAYVLQASDEEYAAIQQGKDEAGVRIWGPQDFFHMIGKDADKGKALQYIADHAAAFFPGVDGIIPIVFGNGENDIPLFHKAEELGGLGVLVAKIDGGYQVADERLPASTLHATLPNGLGIAQALPYALEKLRELYGENMHRENV